MSIVEVVHIIYLLVVRKPNPPRNTNQPIAASAVDTSANCKKQSIGLRINNYIINVYKCEMYDIM